MQSSDWDNPRIVLRRIWIWPLCGQSPDCPRAHPHTINVVHMHVQSSARECWFVYIGWRMVHHETLRSGWKKPFYSKRKSEAWYRYYKQGDDQLSFKTSLLYFAVLFLALLYILLLAWSTFNYDFSAVLFLLHPLLAELLANCKFLIDGLLAYNTVRWKCDTGDSRIALHPYFAHFAGSNPQIEGTIQVLLRKLRSKLFPG